jgi:hypothetical protein
MGWEQKTKGIQKKAMAFRGMKGSMVNQVKGIQRIQSKDSKETPDRYQVWSNIPSNQTWMSHQVKYIILILILLPLPHCMTVYLILIQMMAWALTRIRMANPNTEAGKLPLPRVAEYIPQDREGKLKLSSQTIQVSMKILTLSLIPVTLCLKVFKKVLL